MDASRSVGRWPTTTFNQRDNPPQQVLIPSGPNSVPHHRSLTTGATMPAFHPHEQNPSQDIRSEQGSGHPHQPHTGAGGAGVPSGPNSVPNTPHAPRPTFHDHPERQSVLTSRHTPHGSAFASSSTSNEQQPSTHPDDALPALLRKEVIQPHLPVRLPCYDFVPIASPTFDHSPSEELGHGLRVLPTFVT